MTKENYLQYFDKQYRKKLDEGIIIYGERVGRYGGFRKIFEELLKKKNGNFTIIETGTLRNANENYWAEGRSSFLFYEFLSFFGGELISIDVSNRNLAHCRKALSKIRSSKAKLTTVQDDSVHALYRMGRPADLVYLDSFDLDRKNPYPSMAHHAKELASLGKVILKSKELLLGVDDNFKTFGKGKYVYEWAKETKQEVLYRGYQIIMRVKSPK